MTRNDPGGAGGDGVTFTPDERAYLRSQRLGRLATVDADGAPQCNPVGFRLNPDGTIDIGGFDLAATRKFRNVASNPAVAFVVDDMASIEPWHARGVEVRGTAETVTVDRRDGSRLSSDVIRIHPRRVISWGLVPDGGRPREVAAASADAG